MLFLPSANTVGLEFLAGAFLVLAWHLPDAWLALALHPTSGFSQLRWFAKKLVWHLPTSIYGFSIIRWYAKAEQSPDRPSEFKVWARKMGNFS